jgi:hypothetical protein
MTPLGNLFSRFLQEDTMKCSKARFAFRPLVENLESRLQPGSIITGQPYGWSLLADNLSILDQGSLGTQSLVPQSSSESSKPRQTSAPVDVHGDHLNIAVASVLIPRSETSSLPTSPPLDDLASGLTNADLSGPMLTGHSNSVPLAALATPTVQQPPPATPVGSVPQSPVGVAAPAAPMHGAGNNSQFAIAPAPTPVKLSGRLMDAPPLQSGPTFHVTTQSIASRGITTRSAPAWATYIGFSGEDRLLNITLDPNPSATQPIVVVGFTQNPNDSTDFEGLVARVSNDGSSATLFMVDMGSNSRTEFHSAAVDPKDGSIYVTGQMTQGGVTTDVVARINATLTNVDWSRFHTPTISATGNSVLLDSTGTNLYMTGAVDGSTTIFVLTNLAGPPAVVYNQFLSLTDNNGNPAPSVGNGIALDSTGNLDLAVQIQSTPDAEPGVFQVNPATVTINWGYTFRSTGPNGNMNGIFVDPSDNVFVTGGVGFTNPPLLDELIAGFDSSGNLLGNSPALVYGVDNQGNPVPGQVVGYSVQVDTTANGTFGNNIFTAITDAGTDLVGNIDFLVFDPALSRIVQDELGTAFGSKDDQNRGLVLDPANGALYQVGFTNSPDFMPIKSNAFQGTYGGDPHDGVVIGYTVA